jgi:hypothetical protein
MGISSLDEPGGRYLARCAIHFRRFRIIMHDVLDSSAGRRQHDLKPYLLPSLTQLREGAALGLDGGLVAGGVGAIFNAFVLLLTVPGPLEAMFAEPWPSMVGMAASLGILTLAAMILGIVGAVVGILIGPFVGVSCYLVLTPWIPAELWPKLGAPMRRGMLLGVLFGALAGGLFICLGGSSIVWRLAPDWLPRREIIGACCPFLSPLGLVAGAFGGPLWAVVVPFLRNRK